MASRMMGALTVKAWTIAGTFFVGLGAVGLLVPLMPTTPFLLLALGCYGRGSPRARRWLLENPLFGRYLKSYYEGRGLTLRAKALSIAAVAIGFTLSIIITGVGPLITIIMVMVASGVIIHLLTLPNTVIEKS